MIDTLQTLTCTAPEPDPDPELRPRDAMVAFLENLRKERQEK